MRRPATVWVHALSSAEPGYGGWAYVIDPAGGALTGAAGGARAVTVQTMLLTALLDALAGLEDGAAATICCNLDPDPDAADPALRGRFAAVARRLILRRAANPFTKAWADEGQKIAKTRGAFRSAIPKPNLKGFKPIS